MNSQCYFMGFHLFNFALLQGYTLHSLTRGPCLQLLMYISVQRKRYVLQKWSNCSKGALCTLHGVTKMCMPLNALLGPLKLWIFLHFQGVFKITFFHARLEKIISRSQLGPSCLQKMGKNKFQGPKCPFKGLSYFDFFTISRGCLNYYSNPRLEKIISRTRLGPCAP